MREPFEVIAETLMPQLHQPHRCKEAAHAVIGTLAAAGYAIVPRNRGKSRLVVKPRDPRPMLTGAVAKREVTEDERR